MGEEVRLSEVEKKAQAQATEYQEKVLFRFWYNNVQALDEKGDCQCCEEWEDFFTFADWAAAKNWAPGRRIIRYNYDQDWSPENCFVVSSKSKACCLPGVNDLSTISFIRKWRQMQELAAVKWLHMPEGTTPEEFSAELKRRGLLSTPPGIAAAMAEQWGTEE